MLKKLVILSGLLLTSVTAQASLISHVGYERDSASNVVSGGGLEWLKWDVTKGMSINSALATHAAQGWRLASNIEIAALFNTFQFGSNIFTGVEDTFQRSSSPWIVSEASNHNKFLELFGITAAAKDACKNADCRGYSVSDNFVYSGAVFGSDDDRDGLYKLAYVFDDSIFFNGADDVSERPAEAAIGFDMLDASRGAADVWGVALVRTFDTPPVVTTPGSIGLLALGLVALGYRRRQVLAR
jgi:hypothetical protein